MCANWDLLYLLDKLRYKGRVFEKCWPQLDLAVGAPSSSPSPATPYLPGCFLIHVSCPIGFVGISESHKLSV